MTLLAAACLPCLQPCASRGLEPTETRKATWRDSTSKVQSIDRLDLVVLFSGADSCLLYSSLLAPG